MSTLANAAAVRAFRLIDILARADHPLTLTEVVETIELPKQTVHRILKQLEGAGLVTRTDVQHRYECSALVRRMAVNLLMTSGPAAARHAILLKLSDAVQETCNLTMSSGEDIVYLDRVEANWSLRYVLGVGSRVPYHCTASGKLLLSFLAKVQRERLLEQLPLRRCTERTYTDRRQLREELQLIRKQRFSFNDEEFKSGMIAIAVPVMLGKDRVCAAVAIQTTTQRMSTAQLEQFLPQLKLAAEESAKTFL
ncbi:MAG TPA: IclR family transcriptional regulator [Castellaniella sp.]|uniref:IclR family transcriptional regulator n=1 Tax=Castellaniella sp. TaxID=1955812 RepID=UPI002F108A70